MSSRVARVATDAWTFAFAGTLLIAVVWGWAILTCAAWLWFLRFAAWLVPAWMQP